MVEGRRRAFWEKREEHVPKVVLSSLWRFITEGDTAGEMGRHVESLEHHAEQLAETPNAVGRPSST